MEQLECKKCGIKTNTKYCPNCGERVISERVRTVEEIDRMEDLLLKAIKMRNPSKQDSGLFEITMGLLVNMTLSWVKGGEHTPVEIILSAKDLERSEQGKALIELSRMGVSTQE